MAPKVMKRPAAKSASSPGAKRGRKPDIDPEVKAKCDAVEQAIMAHEPLALSVRKMLCAAIKDTLTIMKENRHKLQHHVVEMLGETLHDIESKYKKDIEEFQEIVDNADANKAAFAQAEKESEAELEKLKAATAAAKEPADADAKSMQDAKAALSKSIVDQTLGDRQVTEIEEKKTRLDSTLKDVFLPMKEAATTGKEGQKQVKVVEKVGKEFALDPSMLDAMLAVVAKEPTERGTFDKMVEKQIEDSFVAQSAKLAVKLEELMPGKKEREDAISEKQAILTVCEEKAKASMQEFETARAAEALGLQTLNENKKKVSNFIPELKKASDGLDAAKAALEKFKTGTLQSFLHLQELAPPPPEPEPMLVEEPAALAKPVAAAAEPVAAAAEPAVTEPAAAEAAGDPN